MSRQGRNILKGGARRTVIAVVFSTAVAACASLAPAGEIRVWPTAIVSGDGVMLRDVAEIRGFDATDTERIGPIVVYGSPRPGDEALVRADDIRDAIVEAGFNRAEIKLFGSSRCRVTRAAEPRGPRATVAPKTGAQVTRERTTPHRKAMARPATTKARPTPARHSSLPVATHDRRDERTVFTIDGRTLEAALRRHIEAGFSRDEGRVEVRFSPTSRKLLEADVSGSTVRIRNQDHRRIGLVSFEIDIDDRLSGMKRDGFSSVVGGLVADTAEGSELSPRGDKTVPAAESRSAAGAPVSESRDRVLVISAEVVLVRDVVVARRAINQGQIITGRDLKLEERRFDDGATGGLADLAAAVGLQSKRMIREGEMVDAKYLESRPLVRRGDLVKIVMSGGGVEIQTTGQAQSAGALGDVIAVRRDGSRKNTDLIDATVVGPGLVTHSESRSVASGR